MADHPVPAPAKKLTKKQQEKLVKDAFEAERRIKAAMVHANESWWDLSEELYVFHESGGWAHLGYGSLEEFLAQPDLGLSRAGFFRMTRAWRDLIIVKKLPKSEVKELEPSKVRQVLPAIMKGEVSPKDALDDARALSYRDVATKYSPSERAKHGQSPDDSTTLSAEDEPQSIKCSVCGSWYTPPAPQSNIVDGTATAKDTTDG